MKQGRRTSIYSGFTLIELIVAVAIFSILILGVMALMSNAFTVNRQQGALLADEVGGVLLELDGEGRRGVAGFGFEAFLFLRLRRLADGGRGVGDGLGVLQRGGEGFAGAAGGVAPSLVPRD